MKDWKGKSGTSEEIIHNIQTAAANYTPEWNFSMEDPDIGSAIAYVYADMTEDTVRQLGRLGYKNQLAFFNSLGAQQRGAVPARGFAVFGLVAGAPEGTEVDACTGVTAEGTEEEGDVRFETGEDLYVTPAQPCCLYLTDGRKDGIYRLSGDLSQQTEPITLFREKGENLQRHELILAHDEILGIRGEAYVEISFYVRPGQLLEERLLRSMTEPGTAEFSYWTGERWQNFTGVSVYQGRLLLHKSAGMPAFEKYDLGEERQSFAIRCSVSDIEASGQILVREIRLKSRGVNLLPQYLYAGDSECNRTEFMPFGERLNLYDEVYFGSDEVFTKRGAQVSMTFHMDYMQVPLEITEEEQPVEWKWVMNRSEFHPDPEYDITVEEVIWEYYNGSGWSRLFAGREYSDMFSARMGGLSQQKTLTFVCPRDIAPVLVNSCETCYIRARILKLNNLFKIKGKYIVPVIGNLLLSYHYQESGRKPGILRLENNLERSLYREEDMEDGGEPVPLLTGLSEKEKTLYIGFETPPVGAPIRMLWVMEDILSGERGSITWEYETGKGFREMNLADLTDHLSRTGLITFAGQQDFCKVSRFGEERYWIRLRDEGGFYSVRNARTEYPVLRKIWMNAVEIRHMDREETESFTLDQYEEDCSFKLLHGSIDKISVEVLEGSDEEERWVVWEEVSDLEAWPGDASVCQVDRTEGIIRFGDGLHGKVPAFGKTQGIRVHYKCGGGSRGNVAQGQVSKLNQTLGFVQTVLNPMDLWGGLDVETPEEAMKRFSARLRHWDRAVTAGDYEELAMEASRALKKVRCFGGKNDKGEREPGAVTLVVYPQKHLRDKSFFCSVREEILRYLGPRMDQGILERGQFYVVEPKMVEIQVKAEVTVSGFQTIFQMRRRVGERIRAFLDPMKGHFDGKGWEIGQLPNMLQIQNILKDIPEIVWISRIYLLAFVNGPRGRQEADLEQIRRHPYVLPVCGDVDVAVTVH